MSGLENTLFTISYYGLSGILVCLLGYTFFIGIRKHRSLKDPLASSQAFVMSLTAVGVLIVLLAGVLLDDMQKSGAINGLFFQQSHNVIFYAGITLVLYGIDSTLLRIGHSVSFPNGTRNWRRSRVILLWGPFIVAVGISDYFLFNTATYTISYSGGVEHVAQEKVFFLPLILVGVQGAITGIAGFLRSGESGVRHGSVWLGFLSCFFLIGSLREAAIIPSSGDPLIDLLIAFVPFTIAGGCLYMATRAFTQLGTEETLKPISSQGF